MSGPRFVASVLVANPENMLTTNDISESAAKLREDQGRTGGSAQGSTLVTSATLGSAPIIKVGQRSGTPSMTKKQSLESTVEKVVSEVLEHQLPQLRSEIARRVLAEAPTGEGSGGSSSADLLKSFSAIHGGSTQRDILRTLLDGSAHYCGRAALLLVKSGHVTGWEGRGFGEQLKDFPLDAHSGLVARVLETRTATAAPASEMDQKFLKQFGKPADGQCILLPLLVKEKVAALFYADAGTEAGGHLDTAALELLLVWTGTWLEVVLVRKVGGRDGDSTGEVPVVKAAAAAASAGSGFADPFAAHTPAFSHAKAAVEEPPSPDSRESEPALDGLSPEDADTHRKAQRFARLLVDEIKLYNQPKVREGREKKDLYDRLKEDIDKSRSTYQKRYGNTAAAAGDYFVQEVIRSLAEDDVSLLGTNFKR
jgi:hypothetical protein